MRWSSDDRLRFLGVLNIFERVLVRAYQGLMLLIIVAVVVVAGLVIAYKPWGAGHQGEWFYFGGAVLLALGWACSQLWAADKRLQREFPTVTLASSEEPVEGGLQRTWRLQIGGNPASDASASTDQGLQFNFSKKIEFPTGTTPADLVPNEESLNILERELARGSSLEEACRLVQPAFEQWTTWQRKAYATLVNGLLEQRQLTNS